MDECACVCVCVSGGGGGWGQNLHGVGKTVKLKSKRLMV